MRNAGLKYICRPVHLRVETTDTPFTNACRKGEVLEIPIGHMEGNYFCEPETLELLLRENRVALPLLHPQGDTRRGQPQRLADNIAGICNEGRNVWA